MQTGTYSMPGPAEGVADPGLCDQPSDPRQEDMLNIRSRVDARELLAGGLMAALLALAAGCGGPGSSQTTIMPTGGFGDFPTSGEVRGGAVFKPVLGTVEGTGSRTFTIQPRTGLMLWVGCIGAGMVDLDFSDIQWANGWACDETGNGSGWVIDPTGAAPGHKIIVHLTAPAGIRWALRVDATSH